MGVSSLILNMAVGTTFGGFIGILWTNYILRRLAMRQADLKFVNLVRREDPKVSAKKVPEIASALNRAQTTFKQTLARSGLLWVFGGFVPGAICHYVDGKQSTVDASFTAYFATYLLAFAASTLVCWFYRRHIYVQANLAPARVAGLPDADIAALRAELRQLFFEFGPWMPGEFASEVRARVRASADKQQLQAENAEQRQRIGILCEERNLASSESATLQLTVNGLCDTLGFVTGVLQKRTLTETDRVHTAHVDQLAEQIQEILTTLSDRVKAFGGAVAAFYCFSDDPTTELGYPLAVSKDGVGRSQIRTTALKRAAGQLEELHRIGQTLIVTEFPGAAGSSIPALLAPVPYLHGCGETNLAGPWYGVVRLDGTPGQTDWHKILAQDPVRAQIESLIAVIHSAVQIAAMSRAELFGQVQARFARQTQTRSA